MWGWYGPIIVARRPVLGARYGLHWNYRMPNGGPCLIIDANWRNIAGIMINTKWGVIWLSVRHCPTWRLGR
jgi:hypothetical protein